MGWLKCKDFFPHLYLLVWKAFAQFCCICNEFAQFEFRDPVAPPKSTLCALLHNMYGRCRKRIMHDSRVKTCYMYAHDYQDENSQKKFSISRSTYKSH